MQSQESPTLVEQLQALNLQVGNQYFNSPLHCNWAIHVIYCKTAKVSGCLISWFGGSDPFPLLVIFVGGQLGLTSNKYLLYFRGVLISWVKAHHEIHEIKTPRIFCCFTVHGVKKQCLILDC